MSGEEVCCWIWIGFYHSQQDSYRYWLFNIHGVQWNYRKFLLDKKIKASRRKPKLLFSANFVRRSRFCYCAMCLFDLLHVLFFFIFLSKENCYFSWVIEYTWAFSLLHALHLVVKSSVVRAKPLTHLYIITASASQTIWFIDFVLPNRRLNR